MAEATYEDDIDDGATQDELAAVIALARLQVQLEDEQAALSKALEDKGRELADVAQHRLPEALAAAGLATLKLASGETVSVKELVKAGIPKETAEDAHDWLREEGHGDLLKRRLQLTFGRGQDNLAAHLKEVIAEHSEFNEVPLDDAVTIPWNTLDAFAKEQLALGVEFPESITVMKITKSEIKRPKRKRADDF